MENTNYQSFIEDLKSKNSNVKKYIESLNDIEYKALTISIRELESSFCIEKSIGFSDYMKDQSTP